MLLTLALLAAALIVPATAGAGLVSLSTVTIKEPKGPYRDYYSFSFRADPGESNRVTIESLSPGPRFRVTDNGAPLRATGGCRGDGDGVLCTLDQGLTPHIHAIDLGDGDDELALEGASQIPVDLGPGNDRFTAASSSGTIDGGPGADYIRYPSGVVSYEERTQGVSVSFDDIANDGEPGEGDDIAAGSVYGTPAADRFTGGPGGERFRGLKGDDTLAGAGGDDTLIGGPGADVIRGGPGFDSASYDDPSGPSAGVFVTLDDVADDGAPGERDDVGSDVESVGGTFYHDRLTGNDSDNVLSGGSGGDVLDGRGGNDTLSTSDGRLVGGPGLDLLRIGPGASSVEALDGESDEIRCTGSGHSFSVDPFDVAIGCAATLVGPPLVTVNYVPLPVPMRVSESGVVRPLVRCAAGIDGACAGRLYLYRTAPGGGAQGPVIARARFSLPVGMKAARVDLKLTSPARRELAKARRFDATALWRTASVSPPSGNQGTFGMKLVAPKKKTKRR